MTSQTIVLITGVSRGIGKALLETYLLRPHHTVIGSVRQSTTPSSQALQDLPKAEGTRLLLVSIESASHTDPALAVKAIRAAGIEHLDVVIANAGICPQAGLPDVVATQDLLDAFHVNTLGPVLLFQAVKPLLDKSAQPKWLSVSTGAASIGRLEQHQASWVTAYGISKAGQNFFTA